MNKMIAWVLIALLGINFFVCGLVSYLGTMTATAATRYPRVSQTKSSSGGGAIFIRSGSVGGGSSRSGGGTSSGK